MWLPTCPCYWRTSIRSKDDHFTFALMKALKAETCRHVFHWKDGHEKIKTFYLWPSLTSISSQFFFLFALTFMSEMHIKEWQCTAIKIPAIMTWGVKMRYWTGKHSLRCSLHRKVLKRQQSIRRTSSVVELCCCSSCLLTTKAFTPQLSVWFPQLWPWAIYWNSPLIRASVKYQKLIFMEVFTNLHLLVVKSKFIRYYAL